MKKCPAPGCGRHFYPRNGRHTYCTPACRLNAQAVPQRQRYGRDHKALRRRLAVAVQAGGQLCARCGEPIRPDEPWDLDHADDGGSYLGPSHRACNRGEPMRRRYEDDPENNIFWGPPDPEGRPQRWSRKWFEWRDEAAA